MVDWWLKKPTTVHELVSWNITSACAVGATGYYH